MNEKLLEPMQFTGLHDSKGKEIWEWDVVQNDTETVFVVKYDPEEAGWFPFIRKGYGRVYEYKILGSVWERPELLK